MKTFAVNDAVLVRHGVQIYDARVLRLDPDSTTPQYFVHYLKWSKKWDEWVGPDRVLDTSPASRELQKQAERDAVLSSAKKGATKKRIAAAGPVLPSSSKKHKSNNPFDNIKKEAAHDLEDFVGGMDVAIPIPTALKKILVDDWKSVTQQDKWIELPRKASVATIINDFLTQGDISEKQAAERESTQEVVKGLVTYFDKAVGRILLYRVERAQYDQIVAAYPDQALSTIYGGEHLLRLFVRLPLLLSDVQVNMSQQDTQAVQGTMVQLLKFLQKRKQMYFLPAYTAATEFTLASAPDAKSETTVDTVPDSESEKPKKGKKEVSGKKKKAAKTVKTEDASRAVLEPAEAKAVEAAPAEASTKSAADVTEQCPQDQKAEDTTTEAAQTTDVTHAEPVVSCNEDSATATPLTDEGKAVATPNASEATVPAIDAQAKVETKETEA
ncbi:chromatin modification-related protein EAF3 [Achlya hypogyna]|uniref:Chromatin modification-related protein EAF3 n=1 Tax=Achlya hypogyna TaxID=1202772 RepID=A0A1V9ZPF9_ACHHY|nr:chromatin modification-related protein EAF3 [Achlya hypogyna]